MKKRFVQPLPGLCFFISTSRRFRRSGFAFTPPPTVTIVTRLRRWPTVTM